MDTLPLRLEDLADRLRRHHHRTRADECRDADDAAGVAVEEPRAAADASNQQCEEEQVLRNAEHEERQESVDQAPHDHDEEQPPRVEDDEHGLGGRGHGVLGHVVDTFPHLVEGGVLQRHEQDLGGEEAEVEPLEGVQHGEQGELGVAVVGQLSHGFAPPMRGETLRSGKREG